LLPPLSGRPIRVELRRSLGPHLAATHIPRRLILLDAGLLRQSGEFERILVHEIFHFAWVRLSNQTRRSWEGVLAAELAARAPGELGWSAEWRKNKLRNDRLRLADVRDRTPAWRRYVCESFCDTSAWLYAGLRRHDEFTLSAAPRRARRRWFADHLLDRLPILV
jgi:hypothetical protein